MTNKEKYINSFSAVEPSDEIKERILSMTDSKKRTPLRVIAIVALTIAMMMLAMFTANAATDGAVYEKISEVSKEISRKMVVMINFNGEDIPVEAKETVTIDEDGKKSVSVLVDLPSIENGETDGEIVIALDGAIEDVIGESEKADTYSISVTSWLRMENK